jgi:hypothetical protein
VESRSHLDEISSRFLHLGFDIPGIDRNLPETPVADALMKF